MIGAEMRPITIVLRAFLGDGPIVPGGWFWRSRNSSERTLSLDLKPKNITTTKKVRPTRIEITNGAT